MRRALPLAALGAALLALAVLVAGRSGEEPYRVRAIFDTASFLIPGADVRVAGVRVGRVAAVEVTPEFRAAVVLDVEDPGYRDFRRDARCAIRPQSLIGEKFVECAPTRARPEGAPAAPPLREVDGERLLPVTQTSTAVDLDLVQNIMRRPYRERLAILLNELGVGLAGRGRELNAVLRRANPALRELDEVLALLAEQNRTLARLAARGDRALAPLARERRRLGSLVANAAAVAQGTAARGEDLEADVALLPGALRELRPTMDHLGELAGEATPVLADLRAASAPVNALVGELGPFARAGTPALRSLGDAARTGRTALVEARPTVAQLAETADATRPVAGLASELLGSLDATGALPRILDFVYYQVAATNGFDALGHYLRANLLVNTCSTYRTEPQSGCSANFRQPDDGAEEAAAAAATSAEAQRAADAAAATAAAALPAPRRDARADAALLEFLFGEDAP